MAFRLGLIGLCTSHPARWVPIIRELARDIEIDLVAVWDSAEVRPAGYAQEFCRQHDIPRALDSLDEMIELVDGVIVHTANWDRHLSQARPFVAAKKSVLIDKPMVGNLNDAKQLRQWAQCGARITGGSSVRVAPEISQLLNIPLSQRGELHTVFASCGTDRFFYGIHGFAMLSGVLGPGVQAVQSVGQGESSLVKLDWGDGRFGLLCQVDSARLPLQLTAVSNKAVYQIQIDSGKVYRGFLRCNLEYLAGRAESPPYSMDELLEPELAAIAALHSERHHRIPVLIERSDWGEDGYDGHSFAARYREAQLAH